MEDGELTCHELVQLVTDRMEGALAPEVEALLDAHVADCSACREYVDQMRLTVDALAALPAEALEHDACMRLLTAYRALRA